MRKLIAGIGALAALAGLAWAGLFLVYIPASILNVNRSDIHETPRAAGLAYEEARLKPADADLTLRGWWIPAETPEAGLLAIHGANGTREMRHSDGLAIYSEMNRRGFSILAIDLRNHGQSDSDGTGRLDLGLKEKHDVAAGLAELRARLPGKPLYAFGLSMGGAALLHALADEEADGGLAGIILLDPLLDHASTALWGAHAATGFSPGLLRPSIWSAGHFFGLPANQSRPLEKAERLRLPILLVQDAADPVTHTAHARDFARRAPQAKLWIAPGVPADHPALRVAGRWGTHGRAFILHPGPAMDEVDRFIAATLPSAALAGAEGETGAAMRQ